MRTPISSIWRLSGRSESTAVAPHHSAASFRRSSGRGDHHQHGAHHRPIPRARAEQQRTRTGKHRTAAHPPLRPTVRRCRYPRDRSDRENAIRRERLAGDFQQRDVDLRRAPDAQVQGQRSVLYRRREHLQLRWTTDQLLRRLAAGGCEHRRSRIFRRSQIKPRIEAYAGGAGSELFHG